jgi:mono/diheme cytochrome c family protein
MRKALKWIGIVVGGLVGLVVLIVAGILVSTGMRLNRTYDIQPEAVTIPTDAAAIERGRNRTARYCTGCHGEDLSGTVIFDDPSLGLIQASNLTSGQGGVGGAFGDAEWVLAIRHGVGVDGKPLLIMPAGDFYYFSDGDLGDIVAYVKSVPPVDNETTGYAFTPMARILIAMGAFGDVINAETIDHTGPRPAAPAPGVTLAYGEYLVNTGGCRTCHGVELSGGDPPNPESPLGPNLTPGDELADWSEADFIQTIRTGVSPHDHELDPEFMPWESIAKLTDDELKAIWLFLQSLPPKEYGNR